MKSSSLLFGCVLVVLCLSSSDAQAQRQQTIGGTGTEGASCMIETSDGGYVVTGSTTSFGAGNSDIYVIKFDLAGTLQWSKTVGEASDEGAGSIIQTADGGYAVVGSTRSYGAGSSDVFILRLDSAGSLQWSRSVGGTGDDGAGSIIQTADGGYAVAGSTGSFGAGGSDVYLIKLDSNGMLQWARTVGGTLSEGASSIVQTTDGGYVVAGTTFQLGSEGYDMYVVRLSSNGTALWGRALGGISYDGCSSMIRSDDGGYVLAGWGQPESGVNDMYIVRLDSSGSLLWSERVGTMEDDWAISIIQTTDGGYIAAGLILEPNYGPGDCYIVKLGADGTILGSRTVGGTGDDYATSIIPTTDGVYRVVGSTSSFGAGQSDFYIAEFDTNLSTCDNSALMVTESVYEADTTTVTPTVMLTTPTVTTPTPTVSSGHMVTMICGAVVLPAWAVLSAPEDGTIIPEVSAVCRWFHSTPEVDRYWFEWGTDSSFSDSRIDSTSEDIISVASPLENGQTYWWRVRAHNENGWGYFSDSWSFSVILTGVEQELEIPRVCSLSQNYPNPFNPATDIRYSLPATSYVTLKVYNLLGQEVATLVNMVVEPGTHDVTFNASGLASGVYLYRLTAGSFSDRKNLVVIK